MTQSFEAQNPNFESVVRESFAKQGLLQYLDATLETIEAGRVSVTVPYSDDLTQQHGFFHAGVTTSIVDVACGYAALTLMPPDSDVLTVEFKVNLVAPAQGTRLIAHGTVIKAGRTLTVCQGEVYGVDGNQQKLCAVMQATMIRRPSMES
jgi:uncharacterized protein (TIGR00369 family)